MLDRFSPRVTYANVTSTLALLMVMGGSAIAAISSIPGSDGVIHGCYKKASGSLRLVSASQKCSKHERAIAFNQRGPQGVQGIQGLQGTKGDTGPANGPAGGALAGTYPSPSLAAPEAYHVVGGSGEPGFLDGWVAFGSGDSTPGFYRDPLGIVHLKGTLKSGTSNNGASGDIFILPAGYRPAESQQFTGGNATGAGQIAVLATGEVRALGTTGNILLTIDGLTFRAGD